MIDLQAYEVWNGFNIFISIMYVFIILIIVLCITLSVPEKWKNLIFEITIIPQTLDIYN